MAQHQGPSRTTGGRSSVLSTPRLLPLLLLGLCAVASAQTTRPAPPHVPAPLAWSGSAPATDQPVVMVFPFEPAGEQSLDWVPAAFQQNLVADLSSTGKFRPSPVQVPEGGRVDVNAVGWAKDRGAAYVVLGSYQLVGNDLRITGVVLDARNSAVIGALKATGLLRDLFTVEDAVAAQAKRLLARAAAPGTAPTTARSVEPTAESVAIQSSGPVQAVPPPMLQTQFEGSALQRSLGDPRSYSLTYGSAYEPQRNQYRYYSSPLYPYSLWGYGYGYGYGYGPYRPFGAVYAYPSTFYSGGARW